MKPMENFLRPDFWIPAVAAPMAGLIVNLILVQIWKRNASPLKEWVLKQAKRKETILVDASANASAVIEAARNEMSYESKVGEALKIYEKQTPTIRSQKGNRLDFVVELGDQRIGVEANTHFDAISPAAVDRYFRYNTDLARVVVISPESTSENARVRLSGPISAGRLNLVTLPEQNVNSDLPALLAEMFSKK